MLSNQKTIVMRTKTIGYGRGYEARPRCNPCHIQSFTRQQTTNNHISRLPRSMHHRIHSKHGQWDKDPIE